MIKLLTVLAIATVAVGCGNGSTDQAAPADVSQVNDVSDADRFDFSAPELDSGAAVSGSELYEAAPLIVTFVVPDCPLCIEDGPRFAIAADDNPDITFVFIHSGASQGEYQEYVSNAGLVAENVIHLQDNGAQLWDRFGVTEQPASVLVDAEGTVSLRVGALGEDGLAAVVEKVMGG